MSKYVLEVSDGAKRGTWDLEDVVVYSVRQNVMGLNNFPKNASVSWILSIYLQELLFLSYSNHRQYCIPIP